MCNILNGFKNSLFCNLKINGYIRQEFLQESVRKNDLSLRIICVIIFVIEIFNIARVVLWSRSGLGTQNNCIYFTMYCALIVIAALWVVLRQFTQRASICCQRIVQYAVVELIFLWHMGLNTYDLYRDSGAGTTVITTALLGLAMFIQVPPLCSMVQFVVGYLLFRVAMSPLMDAGDQLNLTITFVVALTVSLAHVHHTIVALMQQKQILEMNNKLQELVQLDPLTGLLNKTTVECRVEQLLYRIQAMEKVSGLTLFLIDLDEFKGINDRYGHPCGDYVLVEMAESMRRTFEDAAGLGRIGGDEFAVLYDQSITEKQAMELGQRLEQQLGKIMWQNQLLEVRCSVGVCICTLPQCSYQKLYTETDSMLYHAKKSGKNKCCVQKLAYMGNEL